jgi:hypothetical protein
MLVLKSTRTDRVNVNANWKPMSDPFKKSQPVVEEAAIEPAPEIQAEKPARKPRIKKG